MEFSSELFCQCFVIKFSQALRWWTMVIRAFFATKYYKISSYQIDHCFTVTLDMATKNVVCVCFVDYPRTSNFSTFLTPTEKRRWRFGRTNEKEEEETEQNELLLKSVAASTANISSLAWSSALNCVAKFTVTQFSALVQCDVARIWLQRRMIACLAKVMFAKKLLKNELRF